jgi:hypothetical protein
MKEIKKTEKEKEENKIKIEKGPREKGSAQQRIGARGPSSFSPNRYPCFLSHLADTGPPRSDPVIFFLQPLITPETAQAVIPFPLIIRHYSLHNTSASYAYKDPPSLLSVSPLAPEPIAPPGW